MDYTHIILSHKPDIINSEISCDSFELEPWENWKCDHSDHRNFRNPNNTRPEWWSLYNKVKHERLESDGAGIP